VREYLLVLCVAAAVTFLTSGLCRRIALRTGALAKVRDRDVHTIEMPYFGGVAMLLGVAAAILRPRQLPFLGTDWKVTTLAGLAGSPGVGRCDLPGWRLRRHIRPAGAGQVRRPGPRGRHRGGTRSQDALDSAPGSDPFAGRSGFDRDHRLLHRAVLQRREPRRRPRRAGHRRRRYRGLRLLRLLLPAHGDPGSCPRDHVQSDHRRDRRAAPPRRTTSSRPGCSWATPAPCSSACCWPPRPSV
jgi:hypothetical protein